MQGMQKVKDQAYMPRKKLQKASQAKTIKSYIKAKASDQIN